MSSAKLPASAETQSSASRAFDHLSAMEDDLARLNGVLRLFFMMNMEEVVPDEEDAAAIIQTIKAADRALQRLSDKRFLACSDLRCLVFPDGEIPA